MTGFASRSKTLPWLVLLIAVMVAAGSTPAAAAANSANRQHRVQHQTSRNTPDAVSANPKVSRPPTKHCTVSLADHFKSNRSDGTAQQYSGKIAPPKGCPGPWNKIVLNSHTQVSGRQYDRSGQLSIGGVTVWFGTTQEPAGKKPVHFGFSKDITRFAALFTGSQPYSGGYINYTSDVYTGVYDQTVKITFYEADSTHPAADTTDKVLPVPIDDLNPDHPSDVAKLQGLPRNITRAELEVTLKGNGCDEQWFTAVPDSVAKNFPGAQLCRHGAYREAMISVDGQRAGAVGTFPHIYSGGVVPTLWRPVLAINTLNLRPEHLDVTPFAGRLVDGKPHRIGIQLTPIGDTWNVIATLFLRTDHHGSRTSGELTTAHVAKNSQGRTRIIKKNSDSATYDQTARRHDSTAGYLKTSRGRVTTTVHNRRSWHQRGTVAGAGSQQLITQTDDINQRSISKLDGHRIAHHTLSEQYPIKVKSSAADYVNDQNFKLTGQVRMGQQVTRADHTQPSETPSRPSSRHWNWIVDSTGVLARKDGTTSKSDGRAISRYIGTDDRGRPYRHRITANHGKVTSDHENGKR